MAHHVVSWIENAATIGALDRETVSDSIDLSLRVMITSYYYNFSLVFV
jgi:hypothetical protein